jgi:hypothetical protein
VKVEHRADGGLAIELSREELAEGTRASEILEGALHIARARADHARLTAERADIAAALARDLPEHATRLLRTRLERIDRELVHLRPSSPWGR